MSDNKTTELLREGLTERGIEWRSGLKGVTFVGDWCFVEYDNGKLAATCEPVLTPEQAIAATLGGDDKSRWHDLFGTPERAARTMVDMCEGGTFDDCGGCPAALAECKLGDYDALLEWLRGDA